MFLHKISEKQSFFNLPSIIPAILWSSIYLLFSSLEVIDQNILLDSKAGSITVDILANIKPIFLAYGKICYECSPS